MTSPEEALEVIHRSYGEDGRHRAFHAKGVFCRASFTATPRASELTRAAHMSGGSIPVTVRFSNGGGDPAVPDYKPDVRGLATSWHLPDGSRTDLLAQSLPHFPFPDQEGFIEALRVRKPSPSVLVRLPGLLVRHPRFAGTMPANLKAMSSLAASFASRPYYAVHAFRWVGADGSARWIRYVWRPTVREPTISRREARRRGGDYLFDELRERLEREPIRMRLEAQIAAGEDDPHDPSAEWPAGRARVEVGTLEVAEIDPDPDDSIVFDPMRLTDGIEASEDAVLHFRPRVHRLSHAGRTAG